MEILLTGYTAFLTQEWIETAFPDDHVLTTHTKSEALLDTRVKTVTLDGKQLLAQINETYQFDRIVYFSEYLLPHGEQEGELDRLRWVLQACREREVQLLYFSGPMAALTPPSGKSLLANAAEELCFHYAKTSKIQVKVFRLPYLYAVSESGTEQFARLFEQMPTGTVQMDEQGISVELIKKANAQIAHISPTHHFPTGITMPVNRRYELLAWANESSDRYIIEDDYDSEFRMNGHPIPPILSIDACEKVIYINTFSKSLTSTIRISYMVLPEHLANEFYRRLSFYSCTVSTFEQYTLARFISEGYFEKHINRMRLHYGRKRQSVLSSIKDCFPEKECRVIENDSGLHFIIQFATNLPDKTVEERLLKKGIKLQAITHFNLIKPKEDRHQFIINYSNIDADRIMDELLIIKDTIL